MSAAVGSQSSLDSEGSEDVAAAAYASPLYPDLSNERQQCSAAVHSGNSPQVPSNPQVGYTWTTPALDVSQVRWFFRDQAWTNEKGGGERCKLWTPFMGYDSLQLEFQFRHHVTTGETPDKVLVRGGLYQVDVLARTSQPIYWNEEGHEVLRGVWFNTKSWQPLDEESAGRLEAQYVQLWPLNAPVVIPPRKQNEKPKSWAKVELEGCHVEFYGPGQVLQFNNSKTSQLTRTVGVDLLGLAKAGKADRELVRGYSVAAVQTDVIPPVSHLVFMVHGIAQKPTIEFKIDTVCQHQVHNMCTATRNLVAKYQRELYPHLTNHRTEFIPIEWRSKIALDGGVIDTVTVRKLRLVRELGNASVLDVLYYTSPLFIQEIIATVVNEMHRLYSIFTQHNPGFEANGGKVSLIGHSLGSVICYDILTNHNPVDQYVTHITNNLTEAGDAAAAAASGGEEEEEATSDVMREYLDTKLKLLQLEANLVRSSGRLVHTKALPFKVECYFAVGSPLGCFLSVRGVKPFLHGSIDNILPKSAARRFFNLYHPCDPVAYRLEPLLFPWYSRLKPVPVHHWAAKDKVPYEQLAREAFSEDEAATELVTAAVGGKKKGKDKSRSLKEFKKDIKESRTNAVSKFTHPMMNRSGFSGPLPHFTTDHFNQQQLEYRVDYELRPNRTIADLNTGYLELATAHLDYWTSKDTAVFFLQSLLGPDLAFPPPSAGAGDK